jgi:hypothetical protein
MAFESNTSFDGREYTFVWLSDNQLHEFNDKTYCSADAMTKKWYIFDTKKIKISKKGKKYISFLSKSKDDFCFDDNYLQKLIKSRSPQAQLIDDNPDWELELEPISKSIKKTDEELFNENEKKWFS